MNQETIRCERISSDRQDLLHGLLDVFAEAFEDTDTYSSARPPREYSEKILQQSAVIALVARTDEKVIGGLIAYELPKLEQARSEIYIFDLAVSEAYRRQGVATALIDALRDLAPSIGAWVIYVQADYGDEPAINLYTKLGTREDVMHFDIDIDRKKS